MADSLLFDNISISTTLSLPLPSSEHNSEGSTNLPRSSSPSLSTINSVNSTKDEILNTISILDCFILVVGTFGNLISFYLLTRKRLRHMSTMRYLAILCFVDTICLYGWYLSSIYRQLSGDGVKRLENIHPFSCKFIAYLSFTSLQLSSVMMCCLTIDRLLIIVSSRWRAKYSTPKVANIILIISTLVLCILNLIIPIRLGNGQYVEYSNLKNLNNPNLNLNDLRSSTTTTSSTTTVTTTITTSNADLHHIKPLFVNTVKMNKTELYIVCYNEVNSNYLLLSAWNKLHLCIYSLIPFPILFVLNLIVIHMIRVAARTKEAHNRLKHGQQFVIRLLLFLTLSFLFSTLPSTIVYAFWRNEVLNLKYGRAFLNLLNTLQFSRHSSNWLIYIYSSSFIRDEFKKCVLCNENDYEISNGDLNGDALDLADKLPTSLSSSFFYKLQMENINLSDVFNFRKSFNKKRPNPAALNVPQDGSDGENQSLNNSSNFQTAQNNHQIMLQEFERLKEFKISDKPCGDHRAGKRNKHDSSI